MPDSSGGWKISDFVTASATSATAVFAWLAYRYALRSTDPIVECDEPEWIRDNKRIVLRITVRNRAAVSYGVSAVEIRKPKRSMIELPDSAIAPARSLNLSRLKLWPIGSAAHVPFEHYLDQMTLAFVVEPPNSFSSGELRIALTVRDKSAKPRHKRFVISKFIQAAKTKIKADTINNTD